MTLLLYYSIGEVGVFPELFLCDHFVKCETDFVTLYESRWVLTVSHPLFQKSFIRSSRNITRLLESFGLIMCLFPILD